jgi:FXSXX-COOH protein
VTAPETTIADIVDMPLSELLTNSSSVLDEMLRRVLAAAEDESSMTCAFNSAV